MSNGSGSGGGENVAVLLEKFQQAAATTAADRMTRDQLLDELQDAVGLSGKMVTEKDIIRRAEQLLRGG